MTAMGWQIIPGNDIAGFYWSQSCRYIGVGAASILESELPVYQSQSCWYIGVRAASISGLELPVYWSPDIPEHPNIPNPGTPGTDCQKSVINWILLPCTGSGWLVPTLM